MKLTITKDDGTPVSQMEAASILNDLAKELIGNPYIMNGTTTIYTRHRYPTLHNYDDTTGIYGTITIKTE